MSSTRSIHPQLKNLLGLSVIAILVIICAWPGMSSPLFSDDIHQLEWRPQIKGWISIFQPDVFGFYRPIKNALFLAISPLSENLAAWHIVGLIAYLAATAGVFRISSICLESSKAAWLSTCIWALSPTCVSTAIWLSCANISIGIMFAACVFHFHERWAERPSSWSLAASLFFFVMALQCYEAMIAIPALLFVRDFQQRRLSPRSQAVIRYAAYSAVALAYLVLRSTLSAKSIAGSTFHGGFAPDTKSIHLTLSAPWFLWRHFLMWAFPFGKIEILGSYGWLRSASPLSLSLAWVFLMGLLATAALTWKRFRAVSYGILFFVVASIPAGNFIPNFNGPINDAYLSIPSIGLAIAVAAIADLLLKGFHKINREGSSGRFAVLAVLCILLLYRVPFCSAYFRYWASVWQNPAEIMLFASETRPFQFQPLAILAVQLEAKGYTDQAEKIAKQALAEAPWNATPRLALARIEETRGNLAGAENYYRIIIDDPKIPGLIKRAAVMELATILAPIPDRKEDTVELLRLYLRNSRSKDGQPKAVALLADVYRNSGDTEKAKATLERGLNENPGHSVLQAALMDLNRTASPPKSVPTSGTETAHPLQN